MTTAALSAGLLWLGFRVVTLVAGHLLSANVGARNGLYGLKDREPIHTGCGCMAWLDKGGSGECVL